MVRKVGEEYWGDWCFDISSTSNEETRIKYRVVEIVQVREHGFCGNPIDAERIKGIEVEHRPHNYST